MKYFLLVAPSGQKRDQRLQEQAVEFSVVVSRTSTEHGSWFADVDLRWRGARIRRPNAVLRRSALRSRPRRRDQERPWRSSGRYRWSEERGGRSTCRRGDLD